MDYAADGTQPLPVEERSAGEVVKLLSEQVSVLAGDEPTGVWRGEQGQPCKET